MKKVYKRDCDYCGKYYEGCGRNFCSKNCLHKSLIKPKTGRYCDECGAYYIGQGKYFCSRKCSDKRYSRNKKERFMSNVIVLDIQECWDWSGSMRGGYGLFHFNGNPFIASRVAWELAYGEIPKNICVLHKCDRPICCNPNHLFLGTPADNMHDMARKGRASRLPGEKNGEAILTGEQVKEIRLLWKRGRSIASLARQFGMSETQTGRVVHNESWKHIKDEGVDGRNFLNL
jgi:hypothetical protein